MSREICQHDLFQPCKNQGITSTDDIIEKMYPPEDVTMTTVFFQLDFTLK